MSYIPKWRILKLGVIFKNLVNRYYLVHVRRQKYPSFPRHKTLHIMQMTHRRNDFRVFATSSFFSKTLDFQHSAEARVKTLWMKDMSATDLRTITIGQDESALCAVFPFSSGSHASWRSVQGERRARSFRVELSRRSQRTAAAKFKRYMRVGWWTFSWNKEYAVISYIQVLGNKFGLNHEIYQLSAALELFWIKRKCPHHCTQKVSVEVSQIPCLRLSRLRLRSCAQLTAV